MPSFCTSLPDQSNLPIIRPKPAPTLRPQNTTISIRQPPRKRAKKSSNLHLYWTVDFGLPVISAPYLFRAPVWKVKGGRCSESVVLEKKKKAGGPRSEGMRGERESERERFPHEGSGNGSMIWGGYMCSHYQGENKPHSVILHLSLCGHGS